MEGQETEIELPWMPVYWEKLLGGTTHMDAAELGGYILLIAEQWKKGFVPADEKKLMKIARQRSKEKLQTILEKFKPDGSGNLINKVCSEIRMEQMTSYLKSVKAGKKGAQKRWGKHSNPNGNPIAHATTEIRNKKEDSTNHHQQHAHEVFAEKIFTEEWQLDRENLELQLNVRREITPEDVAEFNRHLKTQNKHHVHRSQYLEHLRNWLNTKPKEKISAKKETSHHGKQNEQNTKLGRNSRESVANYINNLKDDGHSEPDSSGANLKVA